MGYTYEDIEYVNQIGIDAWLEEQFNLTDTSYTTAFLQNYGYNTLEEAITAEVSPDRNMISPVFYQFVSMRPDRLKHKLAFALSQILVVSFNGFSAANSRGAGLLTYYDHLYHGAFGNYRDLLEKVTLHPMMGMYLSSIRNQKADYALNTRPDENYAREIMQLFTIGLLELNNDGSLKLDEEGNPIPTYDNDDIEELAKVFTGLYYANNIDGSPASWGGSTSTNRTTGADYSGVMKMYPEYHDITEKKMIDGSTLPAGRNGMDDVEDVLDLLFKHPNTGPFISYRLIQNFVKSNPTPGYVNRVASVFNNNGKGVRGDLKAVIKAILTDPEARDCKWLDNPDHGKLLQPIERTTHLYTAFHVFDTETPMWNRDYNSRALGQAFMYAPTVFNFFSPFFAEETHVQPKNLVSPEFEILNSITAIEHINITEYRAKNRTLFTNRYDTSVRPRLDLTEEINIMSTQGLAALLNRLDILLCRGQLSTETRNLITNTITEYQDNVRNYDDTDAVEDAIFFITVSPDHIIQK